MAARRRKAAKGSGGSKGTVSRSTSAMSKQPQAGVVAPPSPSSSLSSSDRPFYLRRYPMMFVAIIVPVLSVLLSRGSFRISGEGVKGISSASSSTTTNGSNEQPPSPREIVEAIYVGDAYEVLATYPHDPKAFTQGLTYFDGKLYEGTGLNGESELRELEILMASGSGEEGVTGSVLRSAKLDEKYFGEGIAHFHDANGNARIIQITWKEQDGFIYDARTFELLKTFHYETKTNEGWGITYDSTKHEFIASDGSEYLFFWDRDTLQEKRRVKVTLRQFMNSDDEGEEPKVSSRSVQYLNELELVNGLVFANIWYQDVLVAIDPSDGQVVKVYDFTKLYTKRSPDADCFNGISVTDKNDELLVTGKKWSSMFRIKLLR